MMIDDDMRRMAKLEKKEGCKNRGIEIGGREGEEGSEVGRQEVGRE